MKMAKASQADLDMAVELANALESLAGNWGAHMPEKIARPQGDGEAERFDIDSHDDCRRVLQYLISLTRSASLFRVVFGMLVLLDPDNKIVDPDADTLEHHPDVVKALAAAGALDWIECRAMNGQIQIARSLLGTGYEVAVIERGAQSTVSVYAGTLREALAKAMV